MVRYGLIGRGISHSFSAEFFNSKFAAENLDAHYDLFDIHDVSEFPAIIAAIPALAGLNVTSPFKREVIPFLDDLSPEAEALQAVNVIKIFRQDGAVRLTGHNTDWEGFGMTLDGIRADKALVLGTGGASSAVAYALSRRGIEYIRVSRNPLSDDIGYEEASSLIPSCPMIINATPVGMHPFTDNAPAIDYSLLSSRHICYDLIYNPEETLFMKKSAEMGARTINGFQMLVNQALLSWQIWRE